MKTYEKLRKVIQIGVMSLAAVLMAGTGITFAEYDGSLGTGLGTGLYGAGLGLGGFSGFETSGINDITGPCSLNRNTESVIDEGIFNLVNRENELNNLDYFFNTGQNFASGNTEVGGIIGGDVDAAFALTGGLGGGVGGGFGYGLDSGYNYANHGGYLSGASVNPVVDNAVTGPNSENINSVDVIRKKLLNVENRENVVSNVNIGANTGMNSVSDNTIAGGLATGSVAIQGTLENGNGFPCVNCSDVVGMFAESNMAALPAVEAVNSTTGPNSSNVNEFTAKNIVKANIYNEANIENNVNVEANTGENAVNCNTIAGDVATGDVVVRIGVANNVMP